MVELTAAFETLGIRVAVRVEISGDGTPRQEAIERIQSVMSREVERMSQIAGVDVRDQAIEIKEARRIRELPKDRSHVTAAVGSKDPESVTVHRGTVRVSGRTMKAAR